MQTALSFDTLAYSKSLQRAGFTATQAEVLAEQNSKILNTNLATKDDLENLEKNLELKIDNKVEKLRADMFKLRGDMLKWFIASVFVLISVLTAVIRLSL